MLTLRARKLMPMADAVEMIGSALRLQTSDAS